MSHRAAVATIAAAAALDAVCGVLYAQAEHLSTAMGLYCAIGNATTDGACTGPATSAGHWINVVEFVLVVPLVAATFSLLTSGLTATHVRRAEKRIKAHMEDRLRHHIGTRGAGGGG